MGACASTASDSVATINPPINQSSPITNDESLAAAVTVASGASASGAVAPFNFIAERQSQTAPRRSSLKPVQRPAIPLPPMKVEVDWTVLAHKTLPPATDKMASKCSPTSSRKQSHFLLPAVSSRQSISPGTTLIRRTSDANGGPAKTRKKKRRTSHKGLMPALALQFPAIRHSFVSVNTVFTRYMSRRPTPKPSMVEQFKSPVSAVQTGAAGRSARPRGHMKSSSLSIINTTNIALSPPPPVRSFRTSMIQLIPTLPISSRISSASATISASSNSSSAAVSHSHTKPSTPNLNKDNNKDNNNNNTKDTPAGNNRNALAHVTVNQLKEVMEAMTHNHRIFTTEEINSLFDTTKQEFTFREFLIAITMGYYLQEQKWEKAMNNNNNNTLDTTPDPYFAKIAYGFRIVQAAFMDMDKTETGKINLQHLKTFLFSNRSNSPKSSQEQTTRTTATTTTTTHHHQHQHQHHHHHKNTHDQVLEERFKECDSDQDGAVDFGEFLYCVVSWVGLLDDDDELDINSDNPLISLDELQAIQLADEQRAVKAATVTVPEILDAQQPSLNEEPIMT